MDKTGKLIISTGLKLVKTPFLENLAPDNDLSVISSELYSKKRELYSKN
jgi:hypothetical protein